MTTPPPATATTAQTPLLSVIDMKDPKMESVLSNNNSTTLNNNDQELQLYDPTAVLDISREIAFGYLILLTGGAVEYEPPTLEDLSSLRKKPPQDDSQPSAQSQDQRTTEQTNESQVPSSGKLLSTPLDAESASLAYSAIVDGNVLHACFGLKAAANGRVGNNNNAIPTIGDKSRRDTSPLFCCFPTSSSAALQLVLPHAAKNKLKMHNTVDALRELRDLYQETLESSVATAPSGVSKVPTYMQAIHAYIHCFTAIVRYHDMKKSFKTETAKEKRNRSKSDRIIVCCANLLNKLNVLSEPKGNPKLEQLQNDTLQDIERGFRGLKEDIWESLEKMAAETAFTGVSLEESTFQEREE